jgi:hypothetical protein
MQPNQTVAVIGGDVRPHEQYPAEVVVRRFRSAKYGGNGSIRSAIGAIRSGSIDAVVLLTRWMGHSSFRSIRETCQRAGVPCIIVAGGVGTAARVVASLVEGA